MGRSFTKLFGSITDSSVWTQSLQKKVVWVSMLSICDSSGRIFSNIPGLAKVSGVSVNECQEALDYFLSPDALSRDNDFEGRRISEIDGGWLLLNYMKYKRRANDESIRESKMEYMRKWREKQKQARLGPSKAPCENNTQRKVVDVQCKDMFTKVEDSGKNYSTVEQKIPLVEKKVTKVEKNVYTLPLFGHLTNFEISNTLSIREEKYKYKEKEKEKEKEKGGLPAPKKKEKDQEKEKSDHIDARAFDRFWQTWPKSQRKGGKSECLRLWIRLAFDRDVDVICSHIEMMKASNSWCDKGGQYIPAPVVYLRSKAWDGAEITPQPNYYAGGI